MNKDIELLYCSLLTSRFDYYFHDNNLYYIIHGHPELSFFDNSMFVTYFISKTPDTKIMNKYFLKKFCKVCGAEKCLDKFKKKFSLKQNKTYYENTCRLCDKEYLKKYYAENKERIKEKAKSYREQDKEIIKLKDSHYKKRNKDVLKIKMKQYDDSHKKEKQEYDKNYRKKHKQKINNYKKNWTKEKRKTDISFKIKSNLRTRLYEAVKFKRGSAVKNLGCSIKELILYLENKFYPHNNKSMTWENYGTEWHIDHIKPLALFDLSDFKQLQEACHYTNLQPLWVDDHIQKTINDNKMIKKGN